MLTLGELQYIIDCLPDNYYSLGIANKLRLIAQEDSPIILTYIESVDILYQGAYELFNLKREDVYSNKKKNNRRQELAYTRAIIVLLLYNTGYSTIKSAGAVGLKHCIVCYYSKLHIGRMQYDALYRSMYTRLSDYYNAKIGKVCTEN